MFLNYYMFHLRKTIYFIFACIVLHLILYMFEIDVFEFFDKRSIKIGESESSNVNIDIESNIKELEKGLEELKDITKI